MRLNFLAFAAFVAGPLFAQPCCLSKPMVAAPASIAVNTTSNVVSLAVPVTLQPNTRFITATIVKNTWRWQSAACGPTTATPSNGFFLLLQPPATISGTTITTSNPPTSGYREMMWTVNPVNGVTTGNLKMDIQVSAPNCVGCNPKAAAFNARTSTTCVLFRVSETGPIGPITGCTSTCPTLTNYTVTYNAFGVSSTASGAGCP
jgi:hypothetical protein